MAYMTKEGKGPYPNKAGEYCGNHLIGSVPPSLINESPQQTKKNQDLYLAQMRFGKPHSRKAGTSEEMRSEGWVGLYLKEDSNSGKREGEIEVPTPPELTEIKESIT